METFYFLIKGVIYQKLQMCLSSSPALPVLSAYGNLYSLDSEKIKWKESKMIFQKK